MELTLSEWQLELIERVRSGGKYGATIEEVLNNGVHQHVRYLANGGGMYDQGDPGVVEVEPITYGPLRWEHVMEPVTGKAIPVRAGELLRISQVDGGTCVDFNAYNLHDYKEYLDCGFNRYRGVVTGRGTIVWSGSPRGRPMYVIADHSDRFEQYYQGHRCNGVMNEIDYDWVGHPNCQDTFAESIREYGLTPDDVHDSYNLWMRTTVTADGRRLFQWNKAQKDDYVDLLGVTDTLAVPVICGGDISALNRFEPKPMRLQIFAASPSSSRLVALVQERFGRLRSQLTPMDFKNSAILPSANCSPIRTMNHPFFSSRREESRCNGALSARNRSATRGVNGDWRISRNQGARALAGVLSLVRSDVATRPLQHQTRISQLKTRFRDTLAPQI